MSRGLVSARPFAHKKKKHTLKKMLDKTGIPLPNLSLTISQKAKEVLSRTVILIILMIFWTIFLIKGVFFKSEFKMDTFKFSQATISTFENDELANIVYHYIKGKNFFMLQRFEKDSLLKAIQTEFPFVTNVQLQREANITNNAPPSEGGIEGGSSDNEIPSNGDDLPPSEGEIEGGSNDNEIPSNGDDAPPSEGGIEGGSNDNEIPSENNETEPEPTEKFDITLLQTTGNVLGVDLTFKEPFLRVKLGEQEFWIWGESTFFPLPQGTTLGAETFIIDTPQYLTGTTTLSGFFFEISLNDFLHIIPLMQEHIPNMNRFVYLVGSTRLAIFTDAQQVIYFNFRGPDNLQEQFEKYHTLQQYYPNFDSIASIDLGSLDATKVIVKKR